MSEKAQGVGEYAIAEKDMEAAYRQEMEVHKSIFITDFKEQKLAELGREKFDKEEQKLAEEGAKLWDRAQREKRKYRELEEQVSREIMDWKTLLKPLRLWLESEGAGRGWSKDIIENTIRRELGHFQTAQHQVAERLKAAAYDPNRDFRERMLDPQRRQQAIRHFLFNSADKSHWLIKTVELLFSELDKLKRR